MAIDVIQSESQSESIWRIRKLYIFRLDIFLINWQKRALPTMIFVIKEGADL